jgi:hypothetical protein
MLAALQQDSEEAACEKVVELLRGAAAPQAIWDGLFCGAAELLLCQPGIIALHAVTTTNALHYAYRTSADDTTRRLLLLQDAAFLPMFRRAMRGRGQLREAAIERLEPGSVSANGPKAIDEIFTELGRDRQAAVGKTLAYLQGVGPAEDFMDVARRWLLRKGSDPHDYKFSMAALEDYYHISPGWRDRYLAAGVLQLRGPGDRDSDVVKRARAALPG